MTHSLRQSHSFWNETTTSRFPVSAASRVNTIRNSLRLATFNVVQMSTNAYLDKANTLMQMATQIFTRNRFTNHARLRELTRSEKDLVGDLKLLVGLSHNGFKTDPVSPTAWWRQNTNGTQDEDDANENYDQPPPPCTCTRTCTATRVIKQNPLQVMQTEQKYNGKNYIRWSVVLNQFRRFHLEVDSTDEQIKNRNKLLVRKGLHLNF